MPFGRMYVARACLDHIPIGAVYLVCRNRGLSHGPARDVAEEASNEAHLRLLDRDFNEYSDYCRYVTTTACNHAIDQLRRANRTRPFAEDEDFPAPCNCTAELGAERLAVLAAALDRLSEEERQLIRMWHEEGLTYDQMAVRLLPGRGGSANAQRLCIRRRLMLARQRLRGYLE
jgi:RNA polymerase sigma factor (sigma-70 family)